MSFKSIWSQDRLTKIWTHPAHEHMVLMLYYYSFFGTRVNQLLTISIDSKCIISLNWDEWKFRQTCEPQIEMNGNFNIKLKKENVSKHLFI